MEEQPYSSQTYNKEKRKHLCSTCGSSFKKKSDLTRHERIHTGERPFICKFCGTNFSQASSLKTHIRKHTGERPYKCQYCDQTYAHSHRLKSHILKCHAESKERIACQKCCLTADSFCNLQRHAGMLTFTAKQDSNDSDYLCQKEVRCFHCTEVSASDQRGVCISESVFKKDAKPVKSVELSSVSSMKVPKSRFKSKPSDENFMCDVCGSFYANIASLKHHLKSHDNSKPFTCNSCPQSFGHESGLNKHKISHSRKRPFICQVCGSSFTLSGNLKIHMRIHSGEKPYTCEECGTKFTHSQALKAHRKTHIPGRDKHLCKICNSSFSSMKLLNQHLQTHWATSTSFEKSNMSSHPVFVIQEASINKGLRLTSQTDLALEQSTRSRQLPPGMETMNDSQCRSITNGNSEEGGESTSHKGDDQKDHSRSPLTPPLNEIDSFPTFQDHYLSETENVTPLRDKDAEETETVSKDSSPSESSERWKIQDKGNGQNCVETSFISFNDQAEMEEERIAFVNRYSQLSPPSVLSRSRREKSSTEIHLYSRDNFYDGEHNVEISGKTTDSCLNPATVTLHEYQEYDFANTLPTVVEKTDLSNQGTPSPSTSCKHIDSFQFNENAPEIRLTIPNLDLSPMNVNESINKDMQIIFADNSVSIFPSIEALAGDESGDKNEDWYADGFPSSSCPPLKMNTSSINAPSRSSLRKSLDLLSISKEGGPLAENSLEFSREMSLEGTLGSVKRSLQTPSDIEELCSGQAEKPFNTLSSISNGEQQPQNEKEIFKQQGPSSSESFASNKIQDSANVTHKVSEYFTLADESSQRGKLKGFSVRNEDFVSLSISSDSPQLYIANQDVGGGVGTVNRTMVENDLMNFSINVVGRDPRRNGMETLMSTIEEEDGSAEAASKSGIGSLLSRQGDTDSQSILEKGETSSSNVVGQEKRPQGEKVFKTKDLENNLISTNPQNSLQDSHAEQETHQRDESELKCANCPLGLFDASVISVLCQDECFGVVVERNSRCDEKAMESSADESREGRKGEWLPDHAEKQSLQETDPLDHGNDLKLSHGQGSGYYGLIQSKEENRKTPVDSMVAIDSISTSNGTQQSDLLLSVVSDTCQTVQSPSHITREQIIMPANALGMNFQESSAATLSVSENQNCFSSVQGKDVPHLTLGLETIENRQCLNSKAEKQANHEHQHPAEKQENLQSFNSLAGKQKNLQSLNFETERRESFQCLTGDEEKRPMERLTSSPEKHNQQDTTIPSLLQTNGTQCVKRKKNSYQRFSSKKLRTRKVILRGSAPAFTEYECCRSRSFQIKRPRLPRHNRCHVCNARFNRLHHPHDHQERSVRKPHVCQICHLSFIFRSTLKSSFETFIGKTNISIKELHISSASLDKPSECLLLGTHVSCIINNPNFSENTERQPNRISRKEKKVFLCQICGESLSSLLLLNQHINGHTDNAYACNFCSAVFNKRSNLVKHVRIHNGDRPYKCQICLRTFTQKTNLQVHMRIHTGETPFTCQQCGSSFAHSQALRLHMRFHAKDKRFVCQTCGKGFVVKAALDKHLLSHSQEKPFVCKVCGTRLSSKSSLSRHLKRHKQGQGLLPFFCSVCSAQFAQPGHLKLHLKSHPTCRVADKDFQASREVCSA